MDLDHTPTDTTDWTPLIWASYNGDMSSVASLLDSRVNHLFYDSCGRTALHWAVLKGHPGVVCMLLERHTKYLADGHTENLAIRNLSYEQVKKSTLSPTPIELAAETKNNTIFNILIESLQLEFAPAQFNGVWAPSGDAINRLSRPRISKDIETIDQREIGTLPFTRRRLLQVAIGGDKHAIVDLLLTQESEHPNAFGFGVPTALHTALHVAARSRGGSRYVCRLVQHGGNPNRVHSHENTALERAIVFGDEDTIIALLECGASPRAVYLGQTPLDLACEVVVREDPHLPLRLVRKLLAKGASVHTSDTSSPLHTAARFSTLEVIKELVSLGADVTSVFRGQSVLEALADEKGYKVDDTPAFKETLEFLMGHFPPGHTFDSESILSQTLGKCNPDIFLAFINAGFSCTDFNEDDFHVRMGNAMGQRSAPTVSLLLESIQDRDDLGGFIENDFLRMLFRPSQPTGVDRDFLDSFFFLLSHFIEIGVITNATDGLVPLIAEYNGVDPEVIAQALLDCGADRYRVIWNGYDSIAFSAFYGKPEILAVLLHDRPHSPPRWLQWFDSFRPTVPDDTTAVFCSLKKAGILDSIPHRPSPIFIATERGDGSTVSKLILAGANIEKQDYDGWRPLHLALFQDHESVAHILLDAGANVNAATTRCGDRYVKMSWRGRPLHFAAMHGHESVAQRLIALGADINASSIPRGMKHEPSHRPTALHVALDNVIPRCRGPLPLSDARLSVAQLLVDHGADTAGVISHLGPADVLQFANYQSLWDTLRAGQASN